MEITINPSQIQGQVRIPTSKSHTIRALLIATLAQGSSHIHHPLVSADTLSCLNICRQMGAAIQEKPDEWLVSGMGSELQLPDNVLDAGNSGTTLYLACGSAALLPGWSVLTGDEQVRRRPVDQLLRALNDLGAQAFSTRGNGCAPLVIKGCLKGGKTSIRCPASQYLSCLLINTPLAEGDTEIEVTELNEKPYVRMTMDWLDSQNIQYEHDNMQRFFIKGNQTYKEFTRAIPGDFSSATFFLCAAAVTGNKLELLGLDMNDSQGDKAVVSMLERLGCQVGIKDQVLVIQGKELTAQELDLNNTPDALPALAVTACYAQGTTRLVNVPQARLKETDRIKVMCAELKKMGARVEELPAGMVIHESKLKGARVESHQDHRVAMALAIAALGADGPTTINNAECVAITFPDFFKLLESINEA
ncbi:MAG: 3-phosphoshikimate 1-carboxyvinyltransferase [Spirochaetales bacterium]|nr:3-phosphoshikimate 1-carboxyvinyltransferase [Spirochaetales bacterium]